MIEGRRGSVEWTVGKLLMFVLLILVLVLVIYGITTGGFKPLFNNMQGKINEVLILFHIKEDPGSGRCEPVFVKDLNGGNEFLKKMELGEDAETYLNICDDSCEIINTGIGDYLYYKGEVRLKSGSLTTLRRDSSGDVNLEKYRNLFTKSMNLEYAENKKVEDYYRGQFTRQLVIKGEGGFFRKAIFAIWGNGHWKVQISDKRGELYIAKEPFIYEGTNSEEALNHFLKSVGGSWEITYKNSDPTRPDLWKNDWEYRFDVLAPNDEIDSKEERLAFANKIREMLKQRNDAVKTIEEDELKELEGLEISGGYKVSIVTGEGTPYVSLVGNGEEYIITFNETVMLNERLNSVMMADSLSSLPTLVYADFKYKEGDEWKTFEDNEALFLPEKEFAEYYKRSLIKQFMVRYC